MLEGGDAGVRERNDVKTPRGMRTWEPSFSLCHLRGDAREGAAGRGV